MEKTTYRRKKFIWILRFLRMISWLIMTETWQQIGRHCTVSLAESLCFIRRTREKVRENRGGRREEEWRRQRETEPMIMCMLAGIGIGFWNFKAHPQLHTSSKKDPPPNPSQRVPPAGEQTLKCMSLWGPLSLWGPTDLQHSGFLSCFIVFWG